MPVCHVLLANRHYLEKYKTQANTARKLPTNCLLITINYLSLVNINYLLIIDLPNPVKFNIYLSMLLFRGGIIIKLESLRE